VKKQFWLMACAPVLLAACEPMPQANTSPEGFLNELPPSLIEMAAPNQDLTAVSIDPNDGCYLYRYRGPVETTMLPLRARNGQPICSRPPESV